MVLTTEQLASFIYRYREFADSKHEERVSAFRNGFARIATGLKPIRDNWLAELKKEAPGFNIFDLMKVARDEEWHSGFLAYLFNSKEQHGQSSLFIESFIGLLSKKGAVIPERSEPFYVITERYINEINTLPPGRFDIVIEFGDWDRFAIIIENKIDAGDRKAQLTNYYENAGILYDDFLLVYLTPKGGEPSRLAIEEKKRRELEKTNKLIMLSYEKDIADWLTALIDADRIEPLHLMETIKMYVKTVTGL